MEEPQFDTTGLGSDVDLDWGRRFYVNAEEAHFVDGDLTTVNVLYYELTAVGVYYDDGEIHLRMAFDVRGYGDETILTLRLDGDDVETAIREGSLTPTDYTYEQMLDAAHCAEHGVPFFE